jgi:hypothetical protein
MLLDNYTKQSPIIGVAGLGGGINSYIFLSSGGDYVISRSLRFNSADSAYLNRTPSSAGNRKTFTVSFWVKRGKIPTSSVGLISARTSGNGDFIRFSDESPNNIRIFGDSTYDLRTTAVYRDPSAWYHIVVAFDTTQATSSNRIKLYINGTQETTFSAATYPSQNADLRFNNTEPHEIGRVQGNNYFDGFLADIQFIDGQALAATDFGEYDSNSVWQPKKFGGSHGTNGFHLDFSDNSNNAALGTDTSGNSNTWTVNNLVAVATATGTVSGDGTPANASGVGGWAQAFDGNTSNLVYNSNGSTTTTFNLNNSIPWSSKIRIYAGQNGTSGTNIIANGTNLSTSHTWALSGDWQDVTSSLTSPLTSLALTSVSGSSSNIRAVEIDDSIVVQVNGANQDSLIDTPEQRSGQTDSGSGGDVVGNYATWNPLVGRYNDSGESGSAPTFSQGNLQVSGGQTNDRIAATWSFKIGDTGKWFWEVVFNNAPGSSNGAGVRDYSSGTSTQVLKLWYYDGGSSDGGPSTAWTTNDVLGFALDTNAGTVGCYKNGSFIANMDVSSLTEVTPFISCNSGVNVVANFGQRAFAYTAPSGYKALCTANLSDPLIPAGSKYFDTKLYTGNGGTQTVSGLSFSPSLVWIKNRGAVENHSLSDIVRGANKQLQSSSTSAESTHSNQLTGFTSDGFTLGSSAQVNQNSTAIVGWAWDAGSSTVTNTDGSISAQVRANPSAGFSIVKFTAGSGAGSIGHGLSASPNLILMKTLDATIFWFVYTDTTGAGKYLRLNETTATSTDSTVFSTAPSSSVFYPGTGFISGNGYGDTIAYCFSPISGYSKFGSYTGTGSGPTGSPFVYTGFKPELVVCKSTTQTQPWQVFDDTREVGNSKDNYLQWNNANVEGSGTERMDFLSNGFSPVAPSGAEPNVGSQTYIYLAFASHPFKTARAR